MRDELAQELQDHSKDDQAPVVVAKLQCGTNFLKNYDPYFWALTFVEAFPRGDCVEKAGSARINARYGVDWTEILLQQVDKPWFRSHKEWLAATFKFFLRREQIRNCDAMINHNAKVHSYNFV